MSDRLSAATALPHTVARPAYTRAAHDAGIVHIGLGAFHKAHQAVYTDDALAADGGDWRIVAVSPRSTTPAEVLSAQDTLYTLIERDSEGSRARIIGALAAAHALTQERAAVLAALVAPSTRIVSLTVTEKGYGFDRARAVADPAHPAIAADLAAPDTPTGVAGLLVWALRQRHAAGVAPFTVLSCDNLPNNGAMVRDLLVDFATRTAPAFADVIASDVAFPSAMVDRITPATTAETLALAERLTGARDEAAVEAEGFRQWVIEDTFPAGRPAWEAGGAIFTSDVGPYEAMKLRMLNGAHSMLAYTGFLCGHRTVRDVMADDVLVPLIRRHLAAAAATLHPVAGLAFPDYAQDLLVRFSNPNLAHETYQIAMDGSQKMPQRIFAPAVDTLSAGAPLDAFAFATAAWLRYTLGRTDAGETYALRDPALPAPDGAALSADDLLRRAEAIPGLVPAPLQQNAPWRSAVHERLERMVQTGIRSAIAAEHERMPPYT